MSPLVQAEATPKIIKAPQSVVHIKHTISLRQYKIWIILLQKFRDFSIAGEKPDEKGFYRISTSEIKELIGYEPVKEELRADLEKLRREPIVINYLEKDGSSTTHGMGFISEWKVSTKAIRFRIPSFLEDVMNGLDQPKAIFQILNWQIFNHFTGKYEAILYKLCRDYVGVRNTPYMTVHEFREYMGLKDTEYADFKILNHHVIKKPIENINKSTLSDITVSVEYRLSGRKTLGLYFVSAKKNQTSIPFPELEQNSAFRFLKIHIEPATQAEYLELRKPEEIELCIARANEYGEEQAGKGKPPNYGAIYRRAISEGWHVSYTGKKAAQEAVDAEKRQVMEREQAAEKEREAKAEASRQWVESTLAKFDALPEDRKAELRKAYGSGLTDIVRKSFEKRAERAPMHRFKFAEFVEQQTNKHLYKC